MQRLTSSMRTWFRPERKTSAPSAANSLATAAPTEPPAPKTRARFPRKSCELFIRILLRYRPSVVKHQLRRLNDAAADIFLRDPLQKMRVPWGPWRLFPPVQAITDVMIVDPPDAAVRE